MALAGMTGPRGVRRGEGIGEAVGELVRLAEMVSEVDCWGDIGELVGAGGGCTVTVTWGCRGCARAGPAASSGEGLPLNANQPTATAPTSNNPAAAMSSARGAAARRPTRLGASS